MRFVSISSVFGAMAVLSVITTGAPADDDVPAEGAIPSDPITVTNPGLTDLAARRAAGREHLAQLNDEQRYDEAAAVALQILRLTQEEFGDDARPVIEPLLDLAKAQRNGEEPAVAEQNLSAAVTLIERYSGPLSAELIRPLTSLGYIYNDAGLYEKASQSFGRALRLNHVNEGFTNFDQFPIMDGLTESYTSQGEMEEATFYQKSQLEIQQRKLGMDNPETAVAYYKLARWYNRISLFDESILTYRKADRIVRRALGNDSLARVDGLQGLALVYQQIGNRSLSSSILRKALKLVEESANDDPFRHASVLVSLGDSLTRELKFKAAQGQYMAAWQALPNNEAGIERREFFFDRPVRLEGNLFPRYARGARGRSVAELGNGSVLVDFSLDAKGRVTDASIVESDPQDLMDRSFLSIYKRSLFRPRFAGGEAQESDNLLAKHKFLYVKSDIVDDEDSDNAETPDRDRGKLSYPGGD